MSDNNTSLASKDFTSLCEQAASLSAVSFRNDSIDVDDSNYVMHDLSTAVCSLET